MNIIVPANESDQAAVSLTFLQTLIETIPSPLFYADSDGRFRFCNPAFAELFGHDPAHIIGKTIADLVPSVVAGNTYLDQHPGRHIVPLTLWRKTGGVLTINLTDVILDEFFVKPYPDLHPGNYINLEVLDTGTGMPPHILEHIYDPFFTSKKHGEGTGMGLSVVHGIIKSSGGEILVESTPGNGSVFTGYLPILQTRSSVEIEPLTALPRGNEHILFIDDEVQIAEIGEEILGLLGYRVIISTSSLEALELFKLRSNDFDLVVTDMTMPDLTGDRLIRELLRIRPDIPVILCTGFSRKISEETASAIGAKALLMKPLVKNDLAITVRKVLDKAKFK